MVCFCILLIICFLFSDDLLVCHLSVTLCTLAAYYVTLAFVSRVVNVLINYNSKDDFEPQESGFAGEHTVYAIMMTY